MDPSPRKYVPTEAYRLMLLAALNHRPREAVSKGTLAGKTRSSHYAITKALDLLRQEKLVALTGSPQQGYLIQLTELGRRYCQRHDAYIVESLRTASEKQFRYGRRPAWLEAALARSPTSPSGT
ncbi:MAG TPA: hypothetical protein VGB18_01035 [Candidatus Thermoplasmatota archaeon]